MKELKEHQKNYLLAATTDHGCTWKIPDTGFAYPPFDTLSYKNTDAYVVIVFPIITAAIDVRDLLSYVKDETTISESEAIAIAKYTIETKKLTK